jgi:pimeloyl-ACP methyl ester carboxylesterase
MSSREPDRATYEVDALRGQFIASDGAVIPYRLRGSGPPLILLHGWSQSGAMFKHQLQGLSDAFQVIIPDMRGHGESPTPKGGLRMARLAKDLDELIAHLQLVRPNVLGWSMGASVVWCYIDLFGTQRLGKLIFVDQPSMLTIWPGMSPEEIADCGALFTLPQLDELCNALRAANGEQMRAEFTRGMVTPAIPSELFQWILQEIGKTPLPVAADLLWSHCNHDWRDVLERIDRPTLVLCGAISHVNKASQYYIQRCIPNATIREFSEDEGGAHFMFLEAPEQFNSTIRAFLNYHPSSSSRSET